MDLTFNFWFARFSHAFIPSQVIYKKFNIPCPLETFGNHSLNATAEGDCEAKLFTINQQVRALDFFHYLILIRIWIPCQYIFHDLKAQYCSHIRTGVIYSHTEKVIQYGGDFGHLAIDIISCHLDEGVHSYNQNFSDFIQTCVHACICLKVAVSLCLVFGSAG